MQKHTIDILKNFASINNGIVIKKGSRLRTISVMENLFATSELKEEFDQGFAIYDLNEFLATIGLFSDPVMEYKKDHILISSGASKIKYFYSSESVVFGAPEKDLPPQPALISFTLTKTGLDELIKAAAIMKLKEVAFSSKGLRAFNKSAAGNQYNSEIETSGDDDGEYVVNIDNLKMIPGSYEVEVSESFVTFKLVGDSELIYFVAVEAS